MRSTLGAVAIGILVFCSAAFSQKLGKPTLTPANMTAEQNQTVREGIVLHDAKKFAEAIAKYRAVLKECPECVGAMYELALSLFDSGNNSEAMEWAAKGTKYISDELPLFYVMIANKLDEHGKPDDAIKVYLDALKVLKGDERFRRYRASVYFNLGVTYLSQKKYDDAKKVLKFAIENDYRYASPHFLLAYILDGTRYKIPALLAASRFISLEMTTPRAKTAASMIDKTISGATQKGPKGEIVINLDLMAPKDEGDFGAAELLFAIIDKAGPDADEEKTAMSPEDRFADRFDRLIAFLDPKDKGMKGTFVAKNYFPFMLEMKQRGYVKVFAYSVLSTLGNANAAKWLMANRDALDEFHAWARSYELPSR